ncbi:MAG: glycosyltransferase family 4 protein, partial [Candidatus Baldrarchaeia archaeon]
FYGSEGAATNERQLIFALSRKVDKCYLIVLPSIREFFSSDFKKRLSDIPKNVTVFNFPIPHRFPISTIARIIISCIVSVILLISNFHRKIDLIYIRDVPLTIGFLTFKSLSQKTIVKPIGFIEDHIHGKNVIRRLIRKIYYLLDRLVLIRAKRVAVSSPLFYSELVRRRGLKPKNKILQLPSGISMKTIANVKAKAVTIQKSQINIGYLGSFIWWQGIDLLVRAMAIVKEKIPNTKLILIGDGPDRKQIEELCKKNMLNYEITGYLPHKEALEQLLSLDILVLPRRRTSTTETVMPIKILEAWALGIPVIVTKHKIFVKSGFKDKEHLVYCEPESSEVAKAILFLIKNEKIKSKLVKNGLKLAKRFSYDGIAARLVETVQKDISNCVPFLSLVLTVFTFQIMAF